MMLMAAKMTPLALSMSLWLLCSSMVVLGNQTDISFAFQTFNSSSNLIFVDNAMIHKPGVVRLTNDTKWIIGRMFYPTPIQLKQNNTVSPFSTTFVMAMVPPRGAAGSGHGIAFLITPTTSPMGASSAEYLGLFNDTSTGQAYNHVFAVEFDTSQNVEFADPSANHVGLDLNSLTSNATHDAGYFENNEFVNLTLKSGRNFQVWIDYSPVEDQINVTMAPAGMPRSKQPVLTRKGLNLSGIIEDRVYVGFTSATGNFVAEHYILAWSFASGGAAAQELDAVRLPSLMWRRKVIYRTPAFIALICLAAVAVPLVAATVYGCRNRETVEEWEKEFWPHRFSYRDLRAATKGFSEREVLGAGGFGRVYKGVLPGSSQTVAVKSVNKEVKEGIKEFVAEISSMGRMQHRNLVPLRGWCRKNKRLFLVYDYMPHGSLDKMLFVSGAGSGLGWGVRFSVLKGVAAGLLYLHEQWDKCVVHRDIKSSNVLLDGEMNGRLGDFGLAKLYDHSENPETTRVVGTLGYIAPELLYSGKATPASDVFSYGVVLLEVASGRKPVDPSRDETEAILVDWVWELYGRDRIMEAADRGLKGDYEEEEMQRVLHIGLSCCHPQPERRLSIRSVLQILEGQADLPALSMPSMHSSMLGSTPRSGFFSLSIDSKVDGFSTTSSRSPLQSNSETISLL